MKQATLFMIGLITIGSLTALGLQRSGLALGYGYGYGVCTADRPNTLTAEYINNYRRIKLSWAVVAFADCADPTASYRLQLRKLDATLVSAYSDLSNNYKKISANILQTNKPYKFRVKATASDGATTDWSLYKSFRTLPKKPVDLAVTQLEAGTAYIQWNNVPRSKKLHYYHLVVKRGNRVVFSKRISLGLRKQSTGVLVEHLKADVTYRVKVRAVARKTAKSFFSKETFRLE